eukprot:GFUD01043803.1.p1 GENE.GFUD01043803.1~~GFUD01043803.1.p1  ORF type:complete len:348 (-),score=98.72 GFUD01043803.1:89-1069(-)
MELCVTSISLGNYSFDDYLKYIPTSFTTSSISIKLWNPKTQDKVDIVILKKDLFKLETNFHTTAPFICLYLTQPACARINKKFIDFPELIFNTRSKEEDVKRIFIFLTYNKEDLVNLLSTHFKKTTHLTAQRASNLLKISKLKTRQTIQDVEQKLVEIIDPINKSVYMPSKNFVCSSRSTSSYVILFRDQKMRKKTFEAQLESLKSLTDLTTYLRSLHWTYDMMVERMNDYTKECRCINCQAQGFLKCSLCEVRYCSAKCQQEDFKNGHMEICEKLKMKRRAVEEEGMWMVDQVYKNEQGITYKYFVGKIIGKLRQFNREEMRKSK